MRFIRSCAFAACLIGTAGSAWCVTPQQVGNYSGTLKMSVTTPAGTTKQKFIMFLSIGDEGETGITTVTLNGIVQQGGEGNSIYGVTEGIFLWKSPEAPQMDDAYLATAHFKKGAIKGKVTGIRIIETEPDATLTETAVGSFKVKKLN